jgi:hypothetical protein
MPVVGFEPKIPVLQRMKAFTVFYRAATVIGNSLLKEKLWKEAKV